MAGSKPVTSRSIQSFHGLRRSRAHTKCATSSKDGATSGKLSMQIVGRFDATTTQRRLLPKLRPEVLAVWKWFLSSYADVRNMQLWGTQGLQSSHCRLCKHDKRDPAARE